MNNTATRFGLRSTMLVLSLWVFAFAANAQTAPPAFDKSFSPDTIGPGSTSTLTFVISNPGPSPVTSLAFTDNLPAGVTIADPAVATSSCGGTLIAPADGTTITFSDGSLGGTASCSISVNVTAGSAGTYPNTSGDLTSSAGTSGSASADLDVDNGLPGFSKSFSPLSVSLGGRSTLTFTIDNTANTSNVAQLQFSDSLPLGMVIANPANASSTCNDPAGSNTLTATPGTSVVSFSSFGTFTFPVLPAGDSCEVRVDVKATASGMLDNVSGDLLADFVSSGKAGATLNVTVTSLGLQKDFTDDPVPPGGTVTLEFTITNRDRNFDATAISFSDNLDAVLPGLAPNESLPKAACGGTLDFVAPNLTLSGGSLAPEASCTFSVTLQVPGGAAAGSFNNTTSAVNGIVDGNAVVGAAASELLFISAAPALTKSFIDDPVGAGDDVTLRFTSTNTSTSSTASDIAFSDDLSAALPGLAPAISETLPRTECGGTLAYAAPNLTLTGGSLNGGQSCSFDVSLSVPTGTPEGLYTNVTSAITATIDNETVSGNSASDDLLVLAPPRLLKEFTDDPAEPGGTVTLQFTSNNVTTSTASDISFTDDLAAVLPTPGDLVAVPPLDTGTCGGTLTGTGLLDYSGGSLAPGESCTFSVTLDVPNDALPGAYTNTTSVVSATVEGVTALGNPASDDLRIAGLVLTKEFTDDPVLPGATVNLRFTASNVTSVAAPLNATEIFFTDNLNNVISGLAPAGSETLPRPECGGTLNFAGSNLVLSGGTLAQGQSCTFDVILQVPAGAAPDTYLNLTSSFSGNLGGGLQSFDNAADALVVAADLLVLTKEFTDDPTTPGGSVNLNFTLTNLATEAVSDLAFSDDLEAALPGLVPGETLPKPACGGTLSFSAPNLSLTGGSLPAGGSCSIDVTLSVPAAVAPDTVAINLTSQATGTVEGLPVFGDPATDELQISLVTFSKSFVADANPGGPVGLNFNIQNESSSVSLSDLTFIDDLNAVLPGLAPAVGETPQAVCGGTLNFVAPNLVLTGGSLPPSGSCSINVVLTVPLGTTPGDYTNTTSPLRIFGSGELVADPASAILTVAGFADSDGDGVLDSDDVCPGTVIPEGVPTRDLGVNRYALVDDDLMFDTVSPPGGGNGPGDEFTTTDTAGCSCEQIIEELHLGNGHTRFGCSVGAMRNWVDLVTPQTNKGFDSE